MARALLYLALAFMLVSVHGQSSNTAGPTFPANPVRMSAGTVNEFEYSTMDEATKREMINYEGFTFDFFAGAKQEVSKGGFQVQAGVNQDAFTETLGEFGNSLNLINLGPCAGNTPHVHPRGAEISTIVRGTVQFGFVEENAGKNRLVVLDARAGQVVFIPQGLMHFSHNEHCTPAAFIANFGTRDAGTQTIWSAFLAIPTPILAASTNLDYDQEEAEGIIEGWKNRALVTAPATGGAKCLKKCGIRYEDANTFLATAKENDKNTVVPTDQRGNKQNYAAGGISNPTKRCDFLGFNKLNSGSPNPTTCPADIPLAGGSGRHLLSDAAEPMERVARRLESVLPRDRITVLEAADLQA